MNEKTAKRLRKIALGMVLAAEQKSGKEIPKVTYLQDQKTGQIRVGRQSFKGAYKALKNGLRKAHMASAWNASLATTAARQAALRAA